MSNPEFREGVRALFDSLTFRAANNFHGNPEVNKQCQAENDLIWSWAMRALEEVSEEDYKEMLEYYPQYE